jgi:HD domain-containing protein
MVEGEGSRAPLWLLPGRVLPLPAMHRPRFELGVVLGIAALAAAVPAYVYLAPTSVWEPESLLVVLLVLSFVSYSAAAPVRGAVTLDASFVAALVAVVFLGPLPAACVFAAPEISAWIERRRLMSLLGNTASGLWGALAAAWTLGATSGGMPLHPGVQDLPAVALAGAVLLVAGYLVTTVLVSVVWERLNLRTMLEQELAGMAPASAVLLAVGTVTIVLYEQLGLVGLSPLALLVLLPRAIVPRLSQAHDPAKLDRTAAISLFARAIAESLGLDASQKRVLSDAATHLGDAKRLTRIEDFERVMQTVLYCRERWDGEGGFPGILSGDAIPIESRVLAVAEQLGSLTAAGTHGLFPEQAVASLVPRAGTEFDPRVVAAARWTVEEDIVVSTRPRKEAAAASRRGRSWSPPAGRTHSTRIPSGERRVRLARPSGSVTTRWQAPPHRQR